MIVFLVRKVLPAVVRYGESVFCKQPKIGSCCVEIPDPICESENAACLALKEPIKAALEGAKATVTTARV